MRIKIAFILPKPTRGCIVNTRWIDFFCDRKHRICAKLSPSFIKYRIHQNRRGIVKKGKRFSHSVLKVFSRFLVLMKLQITSFLKSQGGERGILYERISTAVYHILENDHAKAIAKMIKNHRLDLYMLAKGVIAHFLSGNNIILISLRCRRKEQAVGIITLIQKRLDKIRLAV